MLKMVFCAIAPALFDRAERYLQLSYGPEDRKQREWAWMRRSRTYQQRLLTLNIDSALRRWVWWATVGAER